MGIISTLLVGLRADQKNEHLSQTLGHDDGINPTEISKKSKNVSSGEKILNFNHVNDNPNVQLKTVLQIYDGIRKRPI